MTNRKRKTMIFLTSQAVTLFGSTLVQMAIVWYVTLHTGEGTWIAAFTVASYLPQFLISFLGGVWADRYHKKALIIGADAGIAAITLAMWFALPYLGDKPLILPLLLTMSALRSVGAGIQTPAVNAVLLQLVPQEDLMRYNGINATMQSVVQFAAPAAAGALLSFSTLRSVLLIDVITAVIGIGFLLFVTVPRQLPTEKTSVFADMKIGARYVLFDKLLRTLLVTYGLFIFFSVPAGFLAQLFVSRTFGETYWYLTLAEVVGFLGMMTGGIVMSTWGGFKKRSTTLTSGLAVFGLIGTVMAVSGHFILYLVLMFVYGIPLTMIQTAVTTMIQENAEEMMQGRVFGLLGTMYAGFLPVGMAVFGPLADVMPLSWIMIGSGVVLMLLATCLLIQAKEEGFYEMFLLDLSTGLRRGELLALMWDDINLETGELKVSKQVRYFNKELHIMPPKTKAAYRTIILPLPLIEMLKEYRKKVRSKWLFPSPYKREQDLSRDPCACRKKLSQILEHAGCKQVPFHALRHTFATQALRYGMDVKTLASTIGHESVETTLNVYAHSSEQMKRDAAKKIDEAIGTVLGADVTASDASCSDENGEAQESTNSADNPKTVEFKPYQPKYRKRGTGSVHQVSKNVWEGRYTPTVNGKRIARNIYANSEEECEVKLAELIMEMKAEFGIK